MMPVWRLITKEGVREGTWPEGQVSIPGSDRLGESTSALVSPQRMEVVMSLSGGSWRGNKLGLVPQPEGRSRLGQL